MRNNLAKNYNYLARWRTVSTFIWFEYLAVCSGLKIWKDTWLMVGGDVSLNIWQVWLAVAVVKTLGKTHLVSGSNIWYKRPAYGCQSG